VSGNSLILFSIDGRMEIRVFEPIKFITRDNKSIVFKPMTVSAAPAKKGN
jgi:hypothetical protein